jgi:hypothetical protein
LVLMRRDIRLLLDDGVVRFGPEGNSLSPVDSVIGSAGRTLRKFFRGGRRSRDRGRGSTQRIE